MADKKLVVSVHDVTPKFKGELSEIVSELDRIGVDKRSILVVPNWENEYDLRNHENFIAWLHELKEEGNEIAQHGYNHRSERREYQKNPFAWFMGELFAQGSGEFQNLTYQEAKEKIEKGEKILSDIELEGIIGFVAPAWLTNKEVEAALKDKGFQYQIYTNFWNYVAKLSMVPIKNLKTGKEIKSREIGFDSSRALIDYGTRTLAWVLTRNKKAPTVRIAIHPKDIHQSRPFDYALKLLEKAKKDRELCTYRELINPKTF